MKDFLLKLKLLIAFLIILPLMLLNGCQMQ